MGTHKKKGKETDNSEYKTAIVNILKRPDIPQLNLIKVRVQKELSHFANKKKTDL